TGGPDRLAPTRRRLQAGHPGTPRQCPGRRRWSWRMPHGLLWLSRIWQCGVELHSVEPGRCPSSLLDSAVTHSEYAVESDSATVQMGAITTIRADRANGRKPCESV